MPAGSSPLPPIAGAHEHVIRVEEEGPARGVERASRASGVFTPPLMDPR